MLLLLPANNDLCSKHGVSGYPTLKIFKNGEVSSDYNGPRDADGIAKYMRSKAGPTSKPLLSVADVEKIVGGFDLVVVGFFTEGENVLMTDFLKVGGCSFFVSTKIHFDETISLAGLVSSMSFVRPTFMGT